MLSPGRSDTEQPWTSRLADAVPPARAASVVTALLHPPASPPPPPAGGAASAPVTPRMADALLQHQARHLPDTHADLHPGTPACVRACFDGGCA